MYMTYELNILLWACVFGLVQLSLAAVAPFGAKGYRQWNVGPRDKPFERSAIAGRIDRAAKNFAETFVFFAVAVLALTLSHKSNELSVWGARLYILGRIIYLPLYAFGVSYVRSLTWMISLLGIGLCLYVAIIG